MTSVMEPPHEQRSGQRASVSIGVVLGIILTAAIATLIAQNTNNVSVHWLLVDGQQPLWAVLAITAGAVRCWRSCSGSPGIIATGTREMGLIRKTLSVGTLGVVSFRGKKEKLRWAERSQRDAEVALDQERSARANAEDCIAEAETRVKKADGDAAHAAKQLEKTKRRHRRARNAKTVTELFAAAEPIVRAQAETAHHAGSDAVARGRKATRRARKTEDPVPQTRFCSAGARPD